jgi:hypothetical protein
VKGRRQDQWLHDYLDGRLSAEERAQAEARIRDDAELARRVEAWRKLGNALREDSAELPPGFYTRAKARFEQTLEPRRRFGHRLFSWEAAGLTAVVVLAVALFVPELMQHRSRGPAPVRPVEKTARIAESEPRKDVAKKRAEASATEPTRKAVVGADAPAPAEPETGRSGRGEFAPAPPESRPAPAREIEKRIAATEQVAASAGERKPRAPAPMAEPGRMAQAPVDPARNDNEEDAVAESVSALRASAARGPTVNIVPLPKTVRVADGIQVIDDRETWDAWLAGPAGPALSRLGSHGPGRRLVLVGRPGGIDCSRVSVSLLQNEHRVAFHDGGGPASGCAFVLSGADGTEVLLEERGRGPNDE